MVKYDDDTLSEEALKVEQRTGKGRKEAGGAGCGANTRTTAGGRGRQQMAPVDLPLAPGEMALADPPPAPAETAPADPPPAPLFL